MGSVAGVPPLGTLSTGCRGTQCLQRLGRLGQTLAVVLVLLGLDSVEFEEPSHGSPTGSLLPPRSVDRDQGSSSPEPCCSHLLIRLVLVHRIVGDLPA
eukprot:scaffold13332_cov64-Cylindrotheca_fusiformis.AAC.1